jgi:hypothetical protein
MKDYDNEEGTYICYKIHNIRRENIKTLSLSLSNFILEEMEILINLINVYEIFSGYQPIH